MFMGDDQIWHRRIKSVRLSYSSSLKPEDRQIRNRKIIIQGTRTPSDKDFGT